MHSEGEAQHSTGKAVAERRCTFAPRGKARAMRGHAGCGISGQRHGMASHGKGTVSRGTVARWQGQAQQSSGKARRSKAAAGLCMAWLSTTVQRRGFAQLRPAMLRASKRSEELQRHSMV